METEAKIRRRRRLRRAVTVLVACLCSLELGYLVGANLFLNSAWGRRTLNRKPETLSIGWQDAWTWWPGVVHLRALEVGGRARRAEWRTTVRRGRMVIRLPALLRRHFQLTAGQGSGVDIQVRVLPAPAQLRTPSGKRPWRVTLDGLELAALRRVRLNDYEARGAGQARGRVSFQVRGPVELELSSFSLDGGSLLDGEATVAQALSLAGNLRIEPFVVGEDTGQDLLAGLSGRVALDTEAEGLGFLTAYLGRVPWLGLGGSGHLTADLEASHGWLAPGSRLLLEGPTVTADLFGLHAVGEGRLEGSVPPGTSHTELAVHLPRFAVTRQVDQARLLEGEGLELLVTNDSNAVDRPAEAIRLALTLPPTRVPDLAVYSTYLPEGSGLELTGGSAELAAELDYDTAEGHGEGRVRLAGRQVAATFHDVELTADLRLDSRLTDARLEDGRIELSGSRLEIDEVHTRKDGRLRDSGWWGRLHLPEGRLSKALGDPQAAPALIEGRVEAELRDTGPLVAMLEQHLPKLAWLDGILTVQEVRAETGMRLQGPELSLSDLRVTGGKKRRLELLGQLNLDPSEPSGVFFARWGRLSAAVALAGGDRDWKLTDSRRWYDESVSRYRSSAAAGSASP